ncbi:MAG TPA: hypothetical protein VJ970_08215 [Flavobacteriaceae bacterium]|nr:hypothetical protein [Flavobacteriaceae bacterium]
MHKKIASNLKRLAQDILAMDNTTNVTQLQTKAKEIYEQLTVLKFVENNLSTLDEETIITEEDLVENDVKLTQVNDEIVDENIESTVEVEENEIVDIPPLVDAEPPAKDINPDINIEQFLEEEEVAPLENVNNPKVQFTLEDEFKEAISSDEATSLFEAVTKENPELSETPSEVKRSLNDALFQGNIQIGLNDRIAFVKHLFNGSQEDFNRVLSQLNSFDTENDAVKFVNKMVKPEYDWTEKETYEERFMEIITRKFN